MHQQNIIENARREILNNEYMERAANDPEYLSMRKHVARLESLGWRELFPDEGGDCVTWWRKKETITYCCRGWEWVHAYKVEDIVPVHLEIMIPKRIIQLTAIKESIQSLFKVHAEHCKHNQPNENSFTCRDVCLHPKERSREQFRHICISDHCPTL